MRDRGGRRTIRILAITPDEHGASLWYRQRLPMRELSEFDQRFEVREKHSARATIEDVAWCDVLHVQRPWRTESEPIMEHVRHLRTEDRPAVVLDFDDNLWEIPEDNHAYESVKKGLRLVDVWLTRCVTAVTFSTVELQTRVAARFKDWDADRSKVLRHGFPHDSWTAPAGRIRRGVTDGKVRIGIVGGSSHRKEIIEHWGALKTLSEDDRVEIVFVGYAPLDACMADLRPGHWSLWPFVPFERYYDLLWDSGIDLGLCLYGSGPFERCHSSIKIHELNALGAPCLAVGGDPVSMAVSEGLVVRNVTSEADIFVAFLEELSDRDAIRRAGVAAVEASRAASMRVLVRDEWAPFLEGLVS